MLTRTEWLNRSPENQTDTRPAKRDDRFSGAANNAISGNYHILVVKVEQNDFRRFIIIIFIFLYVSKWPKLDSKREFSCYLLRLLLIEEASETLTGSGLRGCRARKKEQSDNVKGMSTPRRPLLPPRTLPVRESVCGSVRFSMSVCACMWHIQLVSAIYKKKKG